MPTVYFGLRELPQVPLEAESISPSVLLGKSEKEIRELPLFYGNETVRIDDFFDVKVSDSGAELHIHVEGNLAKVKYLGHNMASGLLTVAGPAGMHLGAGMTGGEIRVDGDIGGFPGAGMSGGLIRVRGQAGHMVGAGYTGEKHGMTGGCIVIHGSCGNEAGARMNGGLLVICGDSGDFAGVEMKSGTMIVLGNTGKHVGALMTGGTIVPGKSSELSDVLMQLHSTFGVSNPLRVCAEALGISLPDESEEREYKRYIGDSNQQGKGEVLVCE